jgi:hypothetical protein
MQNLRAEVQHLRKELAMYKNLYFNPNRVCQNNHYGGALGFGGIGQGISFRNNYLALESLKLKMELIHEGFEPDLWGSMRS